MERREVTVAIIGEWLQASPAAARVAMLFSVLWRSSWRSWREEWGSPSVGSVSCPARRSLLSASSLATVGYGRERDGVRGVRGAVVKRMGAGRRLGVASNGGAGSATSCARQHGHARHGMPEWHGHGLSWSVQCLILDGKGTAVISAARGG